MRSIRQTILSAKIEYHHRRVKRLKNRLKGAKISKRERLSASVNLHKYLAEKALIEYEISEGFRNSHGIWTGLQLN